MSLDNKCFERSPQGRRDSGFFTFGQLNQYVRKLGYRSLLPKFVSREGGWTHLEELQTATLRQLSTEDFLIRLNLRTDLDAAAKSEKVLGGQKTTEASETELAATFKEEFTSRARSYLVSLLEEFLNHISLNADIVKGMATFDPHIILGNSMEQAVSPDCSADSVWVAGWKVSLRPTVKMSTWILSIISDTLTLF